MRTVRCSVVREAAPRKVRREAMPARRCVKQARVAEIESNPGAVSVDQLIRMLAALGATLYLQPSAAAAAPAVARPQLAVKTVPRKVSKTARRGKVADKRGPRSTANAASGAIVASVPKKGTW